MRGITACPADEYPDAQDAAMMGLAQDVYRKRGEIPDNIREFMASRDYIVGNNGYLYRRDNAAGGWARVGRVYHAYPYTDSYTD